MKKCVICGDEFQQVGKGGHNRVVCFNPTCKKTNNDNKKRESYLRIGNEWYQKFKDYSELWSIPIYKVIEYGIDFLKENPIVVETIQLETKLTGRYVFLTEEEKAIRRKAIRRDANDKARQKKENYLKPKNCKICGGEFIPGRGVSCRSLTCGPVCSKELNRIQSSEASRRRREEKSKLLFGF